MAKEKKDNFFNRFKKINFKDKRIILVTLISILVLALLATTSFAMFFSSASSGNKDLIKTGDLVVTFDDSMGSAVSINPAKPVSDAYGKTTTPYKFKITNSGDYMVTYKVVMTDVTSDDPDYEWSTQLPKNQIKYQIDSNNPSLLSTVTNGLESTLISGVLSPGESITHELRLWINENATVSIENSVYLGNISVSGQATNGIRLARQILRDNEVRTDPDFTATSDWDYGESGLFVQQGDSTRSIDGKPTYYFRGISVNNYVKFAGKMWRIVRINEDGSIKLILNSTAISTNDPEQPITTFNTTWYNDNLSNYSDQIQEGTFCTSTVSSSSGPSFVCSTSINQNVGMLSEDEYRFSGPIYLGSSFALISSSCTIAMTGNCHMGWGNGIFTSCTNCSMADASPVINLKANTTIEGGNGTKANPYIVTGENTLWNKIVATTRTGSETTNPSYHLSSNLTDDHNDNEEVLEEPVYDEAFSVHITGHNPGVYKSNNNYYFKGYVENNYVSFSGKRWRILSANSDGTIKLVLDQSFDNYSTLIQRNATEGEYYGINSVSAQLDYWYNKNIPTNMQSKLAVFSDNNKKINFLKENDINNTTITAGTSAFEKSTFIELIVKIDNLSKFFVYYNSSYFGCVDETQYAFHGGIYVAENRHYSVCSKSFDTSSYASDSRFYIYPTVLLKAGTKASGTGTESDPYVIN